MCGNPVLYWNHQQGKDHPPDCFRRLFLWSCWHLYFFYHIGKLWSGTSDSWDLRFNGTVPGDRGSVSAIIAVFETMPAARFGLILLAVTMIAFYATTFDALTMVASSYSYRSLDADEEPDKKVKLFWAITLMLFPIALIFSENSMSSLQSVSIVAAFPIGFIILMIVWSFFKDADAYLHDTGSKG